MSVLTESITYENIWETYQKERQTNQLLLLPKTFYFDALRFADTLEGQNPLSATQGTKENALKLLDGLFNRRKQKILVYVAYNKPLPQPISNRETEFYNKILEETRANKLTAVPSKERGSGIELKSLKDIPAIVLPSGDKAGPFIKDQIITVKNSADNISFLLSNSICEQI